MKRQLEPRLQWFGMYTIIISSVQNELNNNSGCWDVFRAEFPRPLTFGQAVCSGGQVFSTWEVPQPTFLQMDSGHLLGAKVL